MSVWGEVFLGVIALATATTAVVQVALLITAGRAAKRVEDLAHRVERDLQPFFGSMNAIGRDASRAASLATTQVERVDRLFADLAERVDQSVSLVQSAVTAPVREGTALMAGLRAMLGAFRDLRVRGQGHGDDEDVLFI